MPNIPHYFISATCFVRHGARKQVDEVKYVSTTVPNWQDAANFLTDPPVLGAVGLPSHAVNRLLRAFTDGAHYVEFLSDDVRGVVVANDGTKPWKVVYAGDPEGV